MLRAKDLQEFEAALRTLFNTVVVVILMIYHVNEKLGLAEYFAILIVYCFQFW